MGSHRYVHVHGIEVREMLSCLLVYTVCDVIDPLSHKIPPRSYAFEQILKTVFDVAARPQSLTELHCIQQSHNCFHSRIHHIIPQRLSGYSISPAC